MTIVRWGIFPILVCSILMAWGVILLPPGGVRWAAIAVAAAVWLFVVAFFRNPRRVPQGGANSLIAPADGVVQDITEMDEDAFIKGRAVRIGIFLSVFDVHVNRAPCPGVIDYADYRPGAFLDARHPDVSTENEANTLGLTADEVKPGLRLLVRQLTGLIARRIICTHGVGDRVARGEMYGMIRFGSRTELWLPKAVAHELKVAVGDRVRCGETVLVEILP